MSKESKIFVIIVINLLGHSSELPDDAPQFMKEYQVYYKTSRGYHARSINSNRGWNSISALSFMNMPILQYSNEIRNAVLMVHGEKAHSLYFRKDVFKKLTVNNEELFIVPNAIHTELYDQVYVIPFDKITDFFHKYLK